MHAERQTLSTAAATLRSALLEGFDAREALRAAIPQLGGRRSGETEQVLEALLEAAALLNEGVVAPATLWSVRERLARAGNRNGKRLNWRFDGLPRGEEGQRAELVLWAGCRETVPEAREFDAVVAATRNPRILRVLVELRTERLAAGLDASGLTDALLTAFAQRPAPGEVVSANVPLPRPTAPPPVPRPPFGVPPSRVFTPGFRPGWARPASARPRRPTGAELGATARPVARAVLATPAAAGGEALRAAFVGWLSGFHGGDPSALRALRLLHRAGVSEARAALAAIATAGDGPWSAAQRADVLRDLLAPPRAPQPTVPPTAFAPTTTPEPR